MKKLTVINEFQVTAQSQLFETFKTKKLAIKKAIEFINNGYKDVCLYQHSKLSNNTCFITKSIKIN